MADEVAAALAQLNAHIRGMGEADGVITDYVKNAMRQFRSFGLRQGLFFRPAVITLSAAITGAGTATTGSNDFRISAEEDFIVTSVRGTVMLNDPNSEPAVAAAIGTNLTPDVRLKLKAMNCRVTLLNKDTKVPITENEGISMASICPEAGGTPLIFAPDIVPAFLLPRNYTIQAQFALQSANAMFNTASTNYGVALSGIYVNPNAR